MIIIWWGLIYRRTRSSVIAFSRFLNNKIFLHPSLASDLLGPKSINMWSSVFPDDCFQIETFDLKFKKSICPQVYIGNSVPYVNLNNIPQTEGFIRARSYTVYCRPLYNRENFICRHGYTVFLSRAKFITSRYKYLLVWLRWTKGMDTRTKKNGMWEETVNRKCRDKKDVR